MSNPLVSGPVETSSAFAGLGIIESGEAMCASIQSGSWVDGGIAAFSVAMDAVGMVIDPIGSLIAMGLGWLIENLEPLKGWMNSVTGNADEVAGFAQTWTNIAAHLKATGEDLVVSMRRVESLSGETISAYRAANGDAAAHIGASGRWAEGIAAGMQIASMIVGMVHDITRDAISMVVGTAISATITTVATVGFGAPVAAAQVATKVAQLAGKIAKFITRLVRSLGQLSGLVKKLADLFQAAGSGFRNAVPDAPTTPRVNTPSPATVPHAPAVDTRPYLRPGSRPSFRSGVKAQIYESGRGPDGVVRDANTGVPLSWKPGDPQLGVWDAGHVPGQKYSDMWQRYADGDMTPAEFRDWYNNPTNYRPELPSNNRSHRYE